jgi:hypothetical protein
LQIEHLRPVRLRYAHVADQHVPPHVTYTVDCMTTALATLKVDKLII